MKKLFILFTIFSLQIAPTFADEKDANSATGTTTVSGTIMLPDGEGPATGATVLIDGTATGTTADLDGDFKLPNVPANASLKIEYVGCTDKILPAKNNMGTITLDCGKQLDEVVVVACAGDKANGIRKKENIEGECYPTECVTPRWELSGTGKNAKCVEQKCQFENGTGEWVADGDNWICQLKSCDTAKGYKKNDDSTTCIPMLKNCTDNQKSEHPNAKSTGIKKGTEECVATKCKCGFNLIDGKCVQWTDKDESGNPISKCDAMPDNAKNAHLICVDGKAVCKITECVSTDFDLDDQKNKCINKNKKPCTSDDKNATEAEYRTIDGKMICFITDCKNTHTPSKDGTKCNPVPRLSEEDSQKKIDELKDNAQKMRDKEQSTENKLLGAAGIGATGIGAMQMLSASAEQSADQDAEAAMRAYLATFHCNYGMGKNIAGGEKQVELPGGNELIGLYAEYVNLANDLKIRKNALGMRAGIESEPILDSATSGLYDDIAIGKTSGAYTSLARAIMDPTGADAIAWAAQKSDSADKLKSGAITAGVGALGSLAGNLAINSGDAKKNKVNDIIAEFDKKKQKIFQDLESDIKKIPPQVEKCPAGTTGTKHPDCTCTGNAEYNTDNKSCDPCVDGQTIVEGKCTCTGDTPLWDEQNEKCIKQPQQCTAKCTPYDGSHLVIQQDCSCICIDDFTITDDGQSCTCNEQTHEIKDNKCVKKSAPVKPVAPQPVAKPIVITLPADSLFELGSAQISQDAQPALNKFIKDLTDNGIKNCKLTINGYTDGTGSANFNQTLSENRANAVKKHLTDNGPDTFDAANITTNGMGEGYCNCGNGAIPSGKEKDPDYRQCVGKYPNYTNNSSLQFAPCRRVTIELDSNSCQSTTGGDLGNIIQTVASNITQ